MLKKQRFKKKQLGLFLAVNHKLVLFDTFSMRYNF